MTWCLTVLKRFSVDWALPKCDGFSPIERFPTITFPPWLSHCIVFIPPPPMDWEQTKCQDKPSSSFCLAFMCKTAGLGRHVELVAEELMDLENSESIPKILQGSEIRPSKHVKQKPSSCTTGFRRTSDLEEMGKHADLLFSVHRWMEHNYLGVFPKLRFLASQ